jgi:hypothetical protein
LKGDEKVDYEERVALMNRISRIEEQIRFLAKLVFKITYSLAPMEIEEARKEFSKL